MRTVAALAAVFWAGVFFGLLDLGVVAQPQGWEADVTLEASWGSLFTFVVAGACVTISVRPHILWAALVQLMLVAVALLVACIGGLDARPLPVVCLLLMNVAIFRAMGQTPSLRGPPWRAPSWPLAALAVAGAPLWITAGFQALAASRTRADPIGSVTWGIHHWPVHAATLFTVPVATALAAVWAQGRRLLASSACCVAVVVAATSLAHPMAFGSLASTQLSFLAILWALAVGLLSGDRARDELLSAST
jgi:hypothetical protein